MKRQPKTVKMLIDGTPYVSHLAPATVDEWDGMCPACGCSDYHELCTLSQFGMISDSCITLVHCAGCFETFHYCYELPARILETIEPASEKGKV